MASFSWAENSRKVGRVWVEVAWQPLTKEIKKFVTKPFHGILRKFGLFSLVMISNMSKPLKIVQRIFIVEEG